MAPEPLDQEQAIPLYLAGQLTPEERAAFERTLSESAELRAQTEVVLKLREGLARLHERGELAPYLRRPAQPRWLRYARAAAVAAVFLAALARVYRPAAPSKVRALSPQLKATWNELAIMEGFNPGLPGLDRYRDRHGR